MNRSDTNRAAKPQKTVRGLKLLIQEVEGLYYVAKTKALMISCLVTTQLICTFVFAYAKSTFSHDAAQKTVDAKSWSVVLHLC